MHAPYNYKGKTEKSDFSSFPMLIAKLYEGFDLRFRVFAGFAIPNHCFGMKRTVLIIICNPGIRWPCQFVCKVPSPAVPIGFVIFSDLEWHFIFPLLH